MHKYVYVYVYGYMCVFENLYAYTYTLSHSHSHSVLYFNLDIQILEAQCSTIHLAHLKHERMTVD